MIVLIIAVLAGFALVWRMTASSRAYNRGMSLLAQAQRKNDPKAAAAALKAFKESIDAGGQGYDKLFLAADLAGDEGTGEVYEERLMKSAPKTASALLAWYENVLTYHDIGFKSKTAAYGSSRDAAATPGLLEKIIEHYDAAAALKPMRAKAVEGFDNGITGAVAVRLMRIDAMHRELDAVDVSNLRALIARAQNPAWKQAFEAYSAGEAAPVVQDKEAAFLRTLELYPSFAEAQTGLASAYLAEMRVDDAVDAAQKAIAALEKDGPATMQPKSSRLAEAHAVRGKALFERYRALSATKLPTEKAAAALADAHRDLEIAAALDPESPAVISLNDALSRGQTAH
jgi:tetratricopeptide (TPR) repeat protein